MLGAIGIDKYGEERRYYTNVHYVQEFPKYSEPLLQAVHERVQASLVKSDRIVCEAQELVKLEVLEGIKHISCGSNPLEEITLPKSVNSINCNHHKLKSITILSKYMLMVHLRDGLLEEFIHDGEIHDLHLTRNKLTKVHLNNIEKQVLLEDNPITDFKVSGTINTLTCDKDIRTKGLDTYRIKNLVMDR